MLQTEENLGPGFTKRSATFKKGGKKKQTAEHSTFLPGQQYNSAKTLVFFVCSWDGGVRKRKGRQGQEEKNYI